MDRLSDKDSSSPALWFQQIILKTILSIKGSAQVMILGRMGGVRLGGASTRTPRVLVDRMEGVRVLAPPLS